MDYYIGSRWYKCDLHLHTTESKCFEEQGVTPEEWVKRAVEVGLDCVAVTDHNSGENIDNIKAAAQETGLAVFPGVEITCDTSKIHLLILFDVTKSSVDIGDFLIRCGIDRDKFGQKDAFTSLSIFDISEIAHSLGALVIPAHIDDYNGLGNVSSANLNKLFEFEYINAVQVVHREFCGPMGINVSVINAAINEYYNNPTPAIDDTMISDWNKAVRTALDHKLALLTFSDNPYQPMDSKHGLFGIGSQCTWIKMDQRPSLEGLRQAFLLPDLRIKNGFEARLSHPPYAPPALWIKAITIINTSITGVTPLKVNFSPQLTTIIGGRGSGKSSLIRFIRGVFNRTEDIKDLDDIFNDHEDFYKKQDQRTKKGVLNNDSVIEIEFMRNSILYKITAKSIDNAHSQDVEIHKFDPNGDAWIFIEDQGFIDFFQYEQYSQKQIYEIAQAPNALLERIDKAITGLNALEVRRKTTKLEFLEKSAAIRAMQQQVLGKGRVQTEIKDLNDRLELLKESGIAELINSEEKYQNQQNILSAFSSEIDKREELFDGIIPAITIEEVDFSGFDPGHSVQLMEMSQRVIVGFNKIKTELEALKITTSQLKDDFRTTVEDSLWNNNFLDHTRLFSEKKTELEEQGVHDFDDFEELNQQRTLKQREIEDIIRIEGELSDLIVARNALKTQYINASKEITNMRRSFISDVLKDEKIKISFKPFRNKSNFVKQFRTIIQREAGFENDIDILIEMIFEGNVEQRIETFREMILRIRNNKEVNGVSGHFINLIKRLSDAQIDEIEILVPEDEIDVQYKQSGSTAFKPLSTASAGQKTTAILTFILSYGDFPLIIDQPEDDLDNKLIYELIVDRLKICKETRQIIVVTHNANIPVNGDSEYILSMNSDSRTVQVFIDGTVEQPAIKKEICDVMEGTEYAFQMRARRYKDIN